MNPNPNPKPHFRNPTLTFNFSICRNKCTGCPKKCVPSLCGCLDPQRSTLPLHHDTERADFESSSAKVQTSQCHLWKQRRFHRPRRITRAKMCRSHRSAGEIFRKFGRDFRYALKVLQGVFTGKFLINSEQTGRFQSTIK